MRTVVDPVRRKPEDPAVAADAADGDEKLLAARHRLQIDLGADAAGPRVDDCLVVIARTDRADRVPMRLGDLRHIFRPGTSNFRLGTNSSGMV